MVVQSHAERGEADVKVVFRTDASRQIGTGHVVRCLALAGELRARGLESYFVCRMHPGNMITAIRQRGYDVMELPAGPAPLQPAPAAGGSQSAHAGWLGCDWRSDAEQTLRAMSAIKPDMLVIDHYAIDIRWEEVLRPHVRRMVVIDDLADRRHECDFLLDQNWFGDDMSRRYQGMIPDHCVTMLGPRYALLKPEYATLRAHMPPRDGEVGRVLVFMGGSDLTNETGKVMDALAQPRLAHLLVDVVVGVNHPDPQGITHKAAARPAIHVYSGLPSLAGWMARADLMISAGGSTSWERMCLGLPAVVISIAANQTATNVAMQAAGYIDFLGESTQVSAQIIADAIGRCLQDPERLRQMSRRCQDLVPGTGAERVCDFVLG
ncbi:UDP-2,4-diacetamido-2,4,6-trideoxy-beta-L-altropyranose hydrolase [Curvibacter sp. APW13]|uniref:UDP-2,4-diacetamido-2,4, 6-trideoxy-beta-L-altropyranose hydrolase n=1 Tax=Curvibacter sp. APW13 TaxID=3077236 RepID=UPI0028DF232A|nr:UDP-2,4-diacetamido-2,4,6-trideoxy-beta-L-altropyranose hydrolase [Curvibacter sp. APW13]MDT8993102.1 UDP-2,4-diacetamido-2,4,6-trideoxy-beta-L-altropyranose hydrolase [Curvibacter sp. APW13]